jgi:F-type H+-transporting ATPase subunit gamma
MATVREIERRIRSVKNIGQVTRALEAVSASKVRKAQIAVTNTRPYAQEAWRVLTDLTKQAGAGSNLHLLLTERPVKTIDLIVISSDRGLCGAFNYNVIRQALEFVRKQRASVRIISVGRKGRELLFRAGQRIVAEFSNLPATPAILDISPIGRTAIDDFLVGQADAVYIVYTDFINTLSQKARVRPLLPLSVGAQAEMVAQNAVGTFDSARAVRFEYIYEPSIRSLLDTLIPRFTELQVYQAILESIASEHSARMVAMRNATDNAKALADTLTLVRNKARQAAITSELLDIAGGAEALKQVR